jgi:hypothetical protein
VCMTMDEHGGQLCEWNGCSILTIVSGIHSSNDVGSCPR